MFDEYEFEELQKLDFDETDIEKINETDEAQVLGDQYAPIVISGYIYESSGADATQEYLNKFYDGLTLDRDLSSRENIVVTNKGTNDAIVAVTGTTGWQDAVKTWGSVASEGQQTLLSLLTGATGQMIGRAGLAGARQFTDRQTYDERVKTTENTLDKITDKYGDTDTLLLGHSLGGAITRKVALDNNLSSIIYNSAVGKNSIYQNNQRKNIELRINKDIVSMTAREKPREFSFEKGYSMFGTLKAHDIENFIINKNRYYDIAEGRQILVKHHPLDNKKFETEKPKKYKEIDVFRDFYERKCARGFRYNREKQVCEPY